MSSDPGLVPDADTPVFETFVKVRFHEVDALGHVNNAAYLNYLEQAAIDHATALGLGMARLLDLGGVFVARRHDIIYLRPTFSGDVLRVVTWLGEPRGARIDRNYLVFRESESTGNMVADAFCSVGARVAVDGDLVVRATTEWVFANQQGRPRRIPREVITLFRSNSGG